MISKIEKNNQCPCCADLKKTIVITSKSALIDNVVLNFSYKNQLIETSEPILISMRCIHCDPEHDAKIIFDRAEKFDSSHTVCPKCSFESVVFDIRDQFSVSELKEYFSGRHLQVKFIRVDSIDLTTIIEME